MADETTQQPPPANTESAPPPPPPPMFALTRVKESEAGQRELTESRDNTNSSGKNDQSS